MAQAPDTGASLPTLDATTRTALLALCTGAYFAHPDKGATRARRALYRARMTAAGRSGELTPLVSAQPERDAAITRMVGALGKPRKAGKPVSVAASHTPAPVDGAGNPVLAQIARALGVSPDALASFVSASVEPASVAAPKARASFTRSDVRCSVVRPKTGNVCGKAADATGMCAYHREAAAKRTAKATGGEASASSSSPARVTHAQRRDAALAQEHADRVAASSPNAAANNVPVDTRTRYGREAETRNATHLARQRVTAAAQGVANGSLTVADAIGAERAAEITAAIALACGCTPFSADHDATACAVNRAARSAGLFVSGDVAISPASEPVTVTRTDVEPGSHEKSRNYSRGKPVTALVADASGQPHPMRLVPVIVAGAIAGYVPASAA